MIVDRVWRQLSNKWCIKYLCTNCGHDELDNVGYIEPSISVDKQIVCPKCKSMGKDDYKHKLERKIEQLTEQRTNISVEIDMLISESEQLEKEII
jgi:DNA-directed RNA polymerase subunit RPC12/RpoP